MRSTLAAATLLPVLMLASVPAASAAGLSPNAELILTQTRQTADVNAICKDRGALTAAIKSATRTLMKNGKISGNPRSDAMAAGKYIAANCGKL